MNFQKALTAVELLAVVLIIALVFGIGIFAYQTLRTNFLRQQTKTQIQTVATAVEAFRTQNGAYPQTLPATARKPDAWDYSIQYQSTPTGYTLQSIGADGILNSHDDIIFQQNF